MASITAESVKEIRDKIAKIRTERSLIVFNKGEDSLEKAKRLSAEEAELRRELETKTVE